MLFHEIQEVLLLPVWSVIDEAISPDFSKGTSYD